MITISKNIINNILSEQFAYDCVLRGIKSQSNRGVESGGTNGNGTDENAAEDSEGLRPTGV